MTRKHSFPGATAKVIFKVAPTDWHDHDRESMWAIPQGGDKYRLANSPFCAYGYSFEDVVEAKPDATGDLIADRVVERGGHSTYRIMIPKGNDELFNKYWMPIGQLMCTYERANEFFVAVDVPPEVNVGAVFNLLQKGEDAGAWGFEESHFGHPKPLP